MVCCRVAVFLFLSCVVWKGLDSNHEDLDIWELSDVDHLLLAVMMIVVDDYYCDNDDC